MIKRFLFLVSFFFTFEIFAAQTQAFYVDRAIDSLGIDMNMASDPNLIKHILQHDMFLNEVPGINQVLGEMLTKPQSMRVMLFKIREGIISKHPAMVEFLARTHDDGLLRRVDPQVAKRFVNHMYVLEALVVGMKNDWKFMKAVQETIIKKRVSYGIEGGALETALGIYKAGGGIFGAVKAVTMDSVLKMYVKIRERGDITPYEVSKRTKGLKLNIREAYNTDLLHGFASNVAAGMALNTVSPTTVRVAGDEIRIQYVYSQDWTSLYQSWNLAFIIGNLDNLHLILQKLLIPSVLCADPDDYLFLRSLALWTSLNFTLFAKLEERENVQIPNATEIALLFGEINEKYAKAYLESVKEHNFTAKALFKIIESAESIQNAFKLLD